MLRSSTILEIVLIYTWIVRMETDETRNEMDFWFVFLYCDLFYEYLEY